MENLNLPVKKSNDTAESNQNNQLESPLTDKYDSAESEVSDQSDTNQKNVKLNNNVKIVNGNELNSKIVNLTIKDEENEFRKKSNSLKETTSNELNGILRATNNEQMKLDQVQGRKSDNEILVAQTKERMTNKFDLLEKETGVKLRKSGLNFINSKSQETLSNNNNNNELNDNNCSLRANEQQSSPDEIDYAHSNDSESVSSFEVTKHQTISAEKERIKY